MNGSLITFGPSQNNLLHWPNLIHNPFAYPDDEAPIEHIKSARSKTNKQKTDNLRIHLYIQSKKMNWNKSRQLFHQHDTDSYSLESLKSSFSLTSVFHHLIPVAAGITVATNVSVDIVLIVFHNYRLRSVSHCGLSGITVRKLVCTWTGGEWKANLLIKSSKTR